MHNYIISPLLNFAELYIIIRFTFTFFYVFVYFRCICVLTFCTKYNILSYLVNYAFLCPVYERGYISSFLWVYWQVIFPRKPSVNLTLTCMTSRVSLSLRAFSFITSGKFLWVESDYFFIYFQSHVWTLELSSPTSHNAPIARAFQSQRRSASTSVFHVAPFVREKIEFCLNVTSQRMTFHSPKFSMSFGTELVWLLLSTYKTYVCSQSQIL